MTQLNIKSKRWQSEKRFDIVPKMSLFEVSGLFCLSAFILTVDANSNCSYSASNDSLYCTISQLRTIRTVSSHSSGNYNGDQLKITYNSKYQNMQKSISDNCFQEIYYLMNTIIDKNS